MDKCVTSYCRNEPTMKYLGMDLCDKCWTRLASAEFREEAAILAEFGFERSNGCVQPLTKDHLDGQPV